MVHGGSGDRGVNLAPWVACCWPPSSRRPAPSAPPGRGRRRWRRSPPSCARSIRTRSRWRSGSSPGAARQGRIGVGWRTAYREDVEPADEPSVEILEVDRILTELAGTAGAGSQAARQALLTDLFSRATEPEVDFVRRLLTGELRQGALAGVMTDAVATASGIPIAHRPPRRDALGRPRPHRGAGADRRAGRPRGRAARRCCTRSSRCWRPAPPTSPRRSATPARRRWSGSSTARGCRCTGSTTRCASTRATSTTSPTGSPVWWRWPASCR